VIVAQASLNQQAPPEKFTHDHFFTTFLPPITRAVFHKKIRV